MKMTPILTYVICLLLIAISCAPNTKKPKKNEHKTSVEVTESIVIDTISGQSTELTNGEWQPDCQNPSGYLKIKQNELELDLIYGEVGVLSLGLRMKMIQGTGEIHLFFDKISLLRLPMGDEEYYSDPPLEEDISKDRLVGKLIPVSSNRVEFVWNGIYHIPTKKTLYKDNLYYEFDQNGKVLLNHCNLEE